MPYRNPFLFPIRVAFTGVLACALQPQEGHAQAFNLSNGAAWEACTGTLYDSGGSAGSYGNNEAMTATLCPTGGTNGGPLTSITFTTWAVAAGDTLRIHDGTLPGTVLATGTSVTSLLGQTFTASAPSGCLTFVWTSNATGVAAGWSATINTGPHAGGDGSLTVCSNAGPVNLFAQLTGMPESGGAWTLDGAPVPATYEPGTSQPGNYVYTVNGVPPCAAATAQVIMTEVAAPNAGGNRSITICSDAPPFDMRTQLQGSPDMTGTWSAGHGNQFDPATEPSSTFTYTVLGTSPCANAYAVLTITVRPKPNAGGNRTVVVCSSDAPFDLVDSLAGTPAATGTWTGPNGAHGGTFVPGSDTPGNYVYTVTGQAPCTPSTATVTVVVNRAPVAGNSAAAKVCSNGGTINMRDSLAGTPDAGGSWTGPSPVSGGQFDPATMLAGVYTYTVTGLAPCPPASATLNVQIVAAPIAGTSANHAVCSSAPSFDLFGRLGGSPQTGGSWIGPGGPHSATFNPALDPPGVYTYTVTGTAPCANASATVTVSVQAASNAGTNGSVTLCSVDPPESLFIHLGGTPQSPGTWTPPPTGSTPFNGTYQPNNPGHVPGTYTYTVAGVGPCPAVSATVTVVEHRKPKAGSNASVTVCSTNGPFEMVDLLGNGGPGPGNGPDPGGFWINTTNTVVSSTFTPGTTPPGAYRYVVPGTAPCANDTARLTVTVNLAPVAGSNGATSVCSDAASFALAPFLGGSPHTGGVWRDPNNVVIPSGQYNPAVHNTGAYSYTVTGLTPCVNDVAFVNVTELRKPVAGNPVSLTVCNTDAPINLFSVLGGSPDGGGTWSPALPNGIFNPATNASGGYTYTVAGTAPCTAASATVTITVNDAPDAGENGNTTICEGQTVVDLFPLLTGTADLTGTWRDNDLTGRLVGGQFMVTSPTQMPVGTYHFTYRVPANGPCPADSSVVTVTIVPLLNAGSNGTMTVCSSQNQVNLINGLGSSPQAGGTWVDLGATGYLGGQYFNANAAGAGTYHFRYRLAGSAACPADSADLTLTVIAKPNIGTGHGQATFCSVDGANALHPYLGGATPGGAWYGPLPSTTPLSGGFFNPGTHTPGTYAYRLAGTPPCAADTGFVEVTVQPAPNPGTMTTKTLCSSDAAVNMTGLLNGNPAPGGQWTFNGSNHGNMFVPGLDLPGLYVYTVNGTAPCLARSTSLTIAVNTAAYAGNDAQVSICDDSDGFLLFSALGGTPQPTGTWRNPNNQPLPSGIYDPDSPMCPPGDYTYRVSGTFPCQHDMAVVTVNEVAAADAGTSGLAVLCSNGPATNLFTYLGGSPQSNGTWTGPLPSNAPFSGTFTPGVSLAGTYKYRVAGNGPCAPDSATVQVSVHTPPKAGLGRTFSVCQSTTAIILWSELTGNPDPTNGQWYNGSWEPVPGGVFVPTTAGNYTFHFVVTPAIPGSPCQADTATHHITVNPRPSAGNDHSLNLCQGGGSVALFPLLGPTAQTGGSWQFLQGATWVTHSGTLTNPYQAGQYRYTVPGIAPCTSAFATVTVVVVQPPWAGTNGTRTVCGDGDPFALYEVLQGNPNTNGIWTLNGDVMNGIYDPDHYPTGGIRTFIYTVGGTSPCAAATAQATIIQNTPAHAGTGGPHTFCNTTASINLFAQLTGNPANNGTWYTGANAPSTGTFVPNAGASGVFPFKYVVYGDAPCQNDTAFVTIELFDQPHAGVSTAPLLCSDTPPISLLGLLGGTPDLGGTWAFIPVSGAPIPHSGVFDPTQGDGSGQYRYTITATAPCVTVSASAQVTMVAAPNAGLDGALTACLSDNAVHLFNGLHGTPQTGGTWTASVPPGSLNPSTGVFNATMVGPGDYLFTYTRNGTGPCTAKSAVVTLTVTEELDAGNNTDRSVCRSQGILELLSLLDGTPQPGGTWSVLSGSCTQINGVFDPSGPPGTCVFRYEIIGSTNCPGATADLTLHILNGPNASNGGPQNRCSDSGPMNLFTALSPPFDPNGIWYAPGAPPVALATPTIDPATSAPGTYMYVVAGVGDCPADTAFVSLSITQMANPGVGSTVQVCSNGPVFNLDIGLDGSQQAGGQWFRGLPSDNVPVAGGLVDPAALSTGNHTYSYQVQGTPPCAPRFSQVTVQVQAAPVAGGDNTYMVCSNGPAFLMRQQLLPPLQNNGTWYFGLVQHPGGNTFNPALHPPGTYTYIVQGLGACPNDSALLHVVMVTAPRPGTDSSLVVCGSGAVVDLFTALGGSPDSGGVWTDAQQQVVGDQFDPVGATTGTHAFTYTVAGDPPCPADHATVTINVELTPNPGVNSVDTICGSLPVFDLFNALDGSPDLGGIWTEATVLGNLTGSTFDPSLFAPGSDLLFNYAVGNDACGVHSATVALHLTEVLDPGTNAQVTLCSSDAPVDLFSVLGGNPDPGGNWHGPTGPMDGTYDPAVNIGGEYTYSLSATTYCSGVHSIVTVVENALPNAGPGGALQTCDAGTLQLDNTITGEDPGGVWTDANGQVVTSGTVDAATLAAGLHTYTYVLTAAGCTSDTARLALTVVDGVEVVDVERICLVQDRTYTVGFTIQSGDPSTYVVNGPPGLLSGNTFLSSPLFTSEPFHFTVNDANGCTPRVVEGVSPCTFNDDVMVPESFTPNGDHVNDTFVIPGIEGFPENRLAVFSRWGAEVYSAAGYDNRSVVWDGTAGNAAFGSTLPTGTYYYVLELGNGREPLKGFVYLNR